MNVPTLLPEHIDCPDEFVSMAKHVGIKHVQGVWMQFSGHHRLQRTMRADWLSEWQKWLGRELKFEAERARLKVGAKDVPAWPAWQPPLEWERGRATPDQALAALAALERGLVWLTCGHTAAPTGERGVLPKCPHGCTPIQIVTTEEKPESEHGSDEENRDFQPEPEGFFEAP